MHIRTTCQCCPITTGFILFYQLQDAGVSDVWEKNCCSIRVTLNPSHTNYRLPAFRWAQILKGSEHFWMSFFFWEKERENYFHMASSGLVFEMFSLVLFLSQNQLFQNQWTIIFTTTTRLTEECVFSNCKACLQTQAWLQMCCRPLHVREGQCTVAKAVHFLISVMFCLKIDFAIPSLAWWTCTCLGFSTYTIF